MKLFGTDGVRGVANKELNAQLALNLGLASAYIFANNSQEKKIKILVGSDTRVSCDMLQNALVAGILATGADVYLIGVVPTPSIAYLIKKYNMDAGVMISASHNPMRDNGIKFFDNLGHKLSDQVINDIENIVINGLLDQIPKPIDKDIGRIITFEHAAVDYKLDLNKLAVDYSGLKVGLDCANGALYSIAPSFFVDKGVDVYPIFDSPDGFNINQNCGSTHMELLQQHVLKNKLDIGIAFDGDGDRCLMVDELGNIIDGDQIMAICANYMKENGTLKKDTLVTTIMSNIGLVKMCEKNQINIEKTKVGDRYVLEKMLEQGYNFGGEQSGHIIFLDYQTSGDGMLTAIMLLNILKEKATTLSKLSLLMDKYPQVIENAKVPSDKKLDYDNNQKIKVAIEVLQNKYKDIGRVLIRPSGTEALIRVMIEGIDVVEIAKDAKELARLLEAELNL